MVLGLGQPGSIYVFASADHMAAPFRHLLQPKTPFNWTSELDDDLFKNLNKVLLIKSQKEFTAKL